MKTKYDSIPLERTDRSGTMRLIAFAEGYVMARRKGCGVFMVTIDEWVEIGEKSRVVPLGTIL